MTDLVLIIFCSSVGVIIGAVGHIWFGKKATAGEADLAAWAMKLRTAASEEATLAKTKMLAVMHEIEAKL